MPRLWSTPNLRGFPLRQLPWLLWLGAGAGVWWLLPQVAGSGVAPAAAVMTEVTLSSPSTSRIVAVLAAPGDAVTAEQVLVRLDGSGVRAELAVARSDLRRLELEIEAERASLGQSNTETAHRLAMQSEEARLRVTEIQAAAERDRSELLELNGLIERQQKLVDERLASAAELGDLKLRRASLARVVEGHEATLKQARDAARSSEQRGKSWPTAAPSDAGAEAALELRLAPFRAAVEAQQQRVAQLDGVLASLEVRSPLAGRVGRVLLQPGATAIAGAGVITVVDDAPREAIAYVDQMWAARVHVGDRVALLPSDRSGPPRTGVVQSVGAAITEVPLRFRVVPATPGFCREVYVALDPAETPPLPGQAFDATFRAGAPVEARAAAQDPP